MECSVAVASELNSFPGRCVHSTRREVALGILPQENASVHCELIIDVDACVFSYINNTTRLNRKCFDLECRILCNRQSDGSRNNDCCTIGIDSEIHRNFEIVYHKITTITQVKIVNVLVFTRCLQLFEDGTIIDNLIRIPVVSYGTGAFLAVDSIFSQGYGHWEPTLQIVIQSNCAVIDQGTVQRQIRTNYDNFRVLFNSQCFFFRNSQLITVDYKRHAGRNRRFVPCQFT